MKVLGSGGEDGEVRLNFLFSFESLINIKKYFDYTGKIHIMDNPLVKSYGSAPGVCKDPMIN